MLKMPQRSITRFFIPMIDVLTLMFCLYLLLPMVPSAGETESDIQRRQREERLRQLQADLSRLEKSNPSPELQAEIERLRREKVEALKTRLAVRVLEIDGLTGHLYIRDPERKQIRDQADAHRLIERDRRSLGLARKELYYLILYPRDTTSSYPTREQKQKYDHWFADVALGYDIPGAAAKES
jgi:hypothetical protein